MNLADLAAIGTQVILPLALLAWLILAPATTRLLFVGQASVVSVSMAVLILVPIWLTLPWWTPWIYLLTGAAIMARQLGRNLSVNKPNWPKTPTNWLAAASMALITIALATLLVQAMAGRTAPSATVDLAFPMGPGHYLVANGGATKIVNGHFLTLEPKTDRQAAYRGQSFAVDLVKLDQYGFRAPGWRPRDPRSYAIFGEPVYAPCSGTVISVRNDLPDMPVPEMDRSLLEGNHAFIDCGAFGILLAHFRQGSLKVAQGQHIAVGDPLGEVGNSGQSGEPHLHIHAQRLPTAGPLMSGEPLFFTLEGRFLVRNDRVYRQ